MKPPRHVVTFLTKVKCSGFPLKMSSVVFHISTVLHVSYFKKVFFFSGFRCILYCNIIKVQRGSRYFKTRGWGFSRVLWSGDFLKSIHILPALNPPQCPVCQQKFSRRATVLELMKCLHKY